eukprot:TRINITY_DN1978_c0_g1_i3.p2 TRINITY_DN1978_c0_g1~~TRINITY_DN1978_c0_g1_i3.p2  ORF type:complete len:152 (-),score=70.38 TRINITY_DN1978_c0_g1_i3:47-502(-)
MNICQYLLGEVQSLAKDLRKMEKEYYNKRKEIGGEDEIFPVRKENTAASGDVGLSGEAAELQEMEQMAADRDVEIQNLVKGVNDLAVIFKELSVLVIDQGNILDRIDYNIEQAVHHTKKAKEKLVSSEKYQKSRIRSVSYTHLTLPTICSV